MYRKDPRRTQQATVLTSSPYKRFLCDRQASKPQKKDSLKGQAKEGRSTRKIEQQKQRAARKKSSTASKRPRTSMNRRRRSRVRMPQTILPVATVA
jgi:hypothetical protein